MSLFSLSTWSIIWAGWVKGIILSTWLLSFEKLGLIDKLFLKHVGLPHVLVHAVHLVNFFGWMSQGDHSEQLLFFAIFYQSTPSCLKVMGGWWGGPCDFSGAFTQLGHWGVYLDRGLDLDLDQGLTIKGQREEFGWLWKKWIVVPIKLLNYTEQWVFPISLK